MRAIGVHEDVIVVESRIWRTTATLVRSGTEGFVIDSPVLPDELELLPALLEQAGFPFSGLLATHGDWDHLLGRLAFPGSALGVAETTAARLRAHPGAAQLRRASLPHTPGAACSGCARGSAGSGLLRPGAGRDRAASGGRAYRRRHGDLDPLGEGPGVR